MNEFALVAIASIFTSNVVSAFGMGAISLQSEKRNFWHMLVTSLCIIIPTIIVGLVYWIIEKFILAPLDAEMIKLFIVLLLAVLMSFGTRLIMKYAIKELFYLQEKSYTLPIQTAVITAAVLLVNYSRTFLMTMFELSMFCVGFMLVQVLFYTLYEKLDSSYNLKPARNVPLMLYSLSIVSMILYVVEMFF